MSEVEFKESEGWMPVGTEDEGRWTPKRLEIQYREFI